MRQLYKSGRIMKPFELVLWDMHTIILQPFIKWLPWPHRTLIKQFADSHLPVPIYWIFWYMVFPINLPRNKYMSIKVTKKECNNIAITSWTSICLRRISKLSTLKKWILESCQNSKAFGHNERVITTALFSLKEHAKPQHI